MPSYVRGRQRRKMTDLEIIAAYVSGENSEDIALRAGCSAQTVLDMVHRAGEVVRAPGRGRQIPRKITDAEICRMYRANYDGAEIARAAGTTKTTVYRILRENGIERRPRGTGMSSTARAANARKAVKAAKGRRDDGS